MIDQLKAVVARLRLRRPLLDHTIRTVERFGKDNGNQLAAAITLPAFLSFFPLVALALSIAGFVAHYDAGAEAQITRSLSDFFPGLIGKGKGQIDVASIADQRAATGVVGLIGLLLGGLGWVDAMRSSLRQAWHQPQLQRNVVVTKGLDVLALAGVGLAILVSLVATSAATSAADVVVDHTPIPGGSGTEVVLRILAVGLAVGGDVLLFGFLFLRLPEPGGAFRQILDGAVFGAVGFEILKSVGSIYIAHTTHNPLYASFAVVIGLLVWTNLVARLFLFASMWVVTAPYDSDVPPSGTAVSAESAAAIALAGGMPPLPTETRPPGWAAARLAGSASAAVIGGALALAARRAVRDVVSALRRG